MDSSQGNSPGDGGTGSVITEQVKQGTQQALQQTQQTAGEVADNAKQSATSYAESQKQTASQGLRLVASALHQTSENLGKSTQGPIVDFPSNAGTKVDEFASYLESTPVRELVRDVEDYARRNSTLFLGGAFALGLAAARFLKASTPRPDTSQSDYGSSYGYGSSYTPALPAGGSYAGGSEYASSSNTYAGNSFESVSPAYNATSEVVVVDEIEYPDATVFDAEGDTTDGSSV